MSFGNTPVPVNGSEVKELPLENETIVETVALLSKRMGEDLRKAAFDN